MKKIIILKTLLLLLLLYPSSSKATDGYIKNVDSTEQLSIGICSQNINDKIRRVLQYYPTQLYFGDVLYIVWQDENISGTPEKIKNYENYILDPNISIKISCPLTPISYTYNIELSIPDGNLTGNNLDLRNPPPFLEIKENEIHTQQSVALELPPLEDWNNPFWEKIRNEKSLFSEGLPISIQLSFYGTNYKFNILLKARSKKELDILDSWYLSTPKDYFPDFVPPNRKHTRQYKDIMSCMFYPYKIADNPLPYCYLNRIGNRKPGPPHNPSSLDEWLKIEELFTSGSLRDEIEFVIKQLEYFETCKDLRHKEEVENRFIDWFNNLPFPQKRCFEDFIFGRLSFPYNENVPAFIQIGNQEIANRINSERYKNLNFKNEIRLDTADTNNKKFFNIDIERVDDQLQQEIRNEVENEIENRVNSRIERIIQKEKQWIYSNGKYKGFEEEYLRLFRLKLEQKLKFDLHSSNIENQQTTNISLPSQSFE